MTDVLQTKLRSQLNCELLIGCGKVEAFPVRRLIASVVDEGIALMRDLAELEGRKVRSAPGSLGTLGEVESAEAEPLVQ